MTLHRHPTAATQPDFIPCGPGYTEVLMGGARVMRLCRAYQPTIGSSGYVGHVPGHYTWEVWTEDDCRMVAEFRTLAEAKAFAAEQERLGAEQERRIAEEDAREEAFNNGQFGVGA